MSLKCLPQRPVADNHKLRVRHDFLDAGHGADEIFAALLGNQPANKKDHGAPVSHRTRIKEGDIGARVMHDRFFGGKSFGNGLLANELRNANESGRMRLQEMPALDISARHQVVVYRNVVSMESDHQRYVQGLC